MKSGAAFAAGFAIFLSAAGSDASAQQTPMLMPRPKPPPLSDVLAQAYLSDLALARPQIQGCEWVYDESMKRLVCKRAGGTNGGPKITGGGGCGGNSACGANNRPGYRWDYDPRRGLLSPRADRDVVQFPDALERTFPDAKTLSRESQVKER